MEFSRRPLGVVRAHPEETWNWSIPKRSEQVYTAEYRGSPSGNPGMKRSPSWYLRTIACSTKAPQNGHGSVRGDGFLRETRLAAKPQVLQHSPLAAK